MKLENPTVKAHTKHMTALPVSSIVRAYDHHDTEKIVHNLALLNFHDLAELLEKVPRHKAELFMLLTPQQQSKVATIVNRKTKRIIFPKLTGKQIADFIKFTDEDDAVDILRFLSVGIQSGVLSCLSPERKTRIENYLSYHPETAGSMMDTNYIFVKPDFTLKDVARKVERHANFENKSPLIVTVRDDGRVVGYVPYRNLIISKPDILVKTLFIPLPLISVHSDKSLIVKTLSRHKSEVVGVTDAHDTLLGIVHVKDLLSMLESKTTQEVYNFAGVHHDEDALDPARFAVHHRWKWLVVNLATAFIAAYVVYLFEGTIAQMAVLATFMPIVAGMGGNAGTQSLAVVIRGLALGEVTWHNAGHVVWKEVAAGCMNGVIVASLTIPFSLLLTQNMMLSFVLGSALILNMIVAGLFGAVIPLTLKAMNIDPAITSSVFVTTTTDVFGFFVFLGLATLFLV